MSGICKRDGKVSAGKVLAAAVGILMTGFLFAAGSDLYSRLFRKAA